MRQIITEHITLLLEALKPSEVRNHLGLCSLVQSFHRSCKTKNTFINLFKFHT